MEAEERTKVRELLEYLQANPDKVPKVIDEISKMAGAPFWSDDPPAVAFLQGVRVAVHAFDKAGGRAPA